MGVSFFTQLFARDLLKGSYFPLNFNLKIFLGWDLTGNSQVPPTFPSVSVISAFPGPDTMRIDSKDISNWISWPKLP